MTIGDLPTLNATLNGVAAVLLGSGYAMIRRRSVRAHRAFMVSAWVTSMLFLASYSVYHALAGSKPYPGQGPARMLYFAILIPHVVLAAAVVPLAVLTLARGLSGHYAAHRRVARWTLPIWLYVSVTGVVVYLMLYVF
jgi:uncharacterized membrane protein YozB (DUF420 family)